MQAKDIEDFVDILDMADSDACTGWETDFTADMQSRYSQYGDNMFVTEKQLEQLKRIAHWE